MTSRHEAQGSHVVLVFADGEQRVRAVCASRDDAVKAAKLLDRAHYVQNRFRQYTEAARCIARAECVRGFEWVGQDAELGA